MSRPASTSIIFRLLQWVLPAAGIVFLLASFGWAIQQRQFDPIAKGLGLVGLLLFFTMFIRAEAANLRHYLHAGFYSLCMLGIGVMLYLFTMRYDARFDLTSNKVHSLTDATESYLRLLGKDVEIVVFDTDDVPYRDLLELYSASTPRVKWSIHDPLADPVFTRQFDPIISENVLYIRSGEKKMRLSKGEFNEHAVTNGIVEVTRDQVIKVCFLTGHGELAFNTPPKESSATPSVGIFKDFLASRVMQVEELDLIKRGFIPKDASLLVIAGPTRDLSPAEANQLEAYLTAGGRLLLLFNLPRQTGASVNYPNLIGVMRRFGLDDKEQVIVDLAGKQTQGHPLKIPVAWFNDKHAITQSMGSTTQGEIVLPLVRFLNPVDPAVKGFKLAPLMATGEEAWAEDFVKLGTSETSAPDATDRLPLAWAIEADKESPAPGVRIAAFGTAEIVQNSYIVSNNTAALLMLNTINWLVAQEDMITVNSRVIPGTPLVLSEGEIQLMLILIVLAFPSLLCFGGIVYVKLIQRRGGA